jgi:hypothetical protein
LPLTSTTPPLRPPLPLPLLLLLLLLLLLPPPPPPLPLLLLLPLPLPLLPPPPPLPLLLLLLPAALQPHSVARHFLFDPTVVVCNSIAAPIIVHSRYHTRIPIAFVSPVPAHSPPPLQPATSTTSTITHLLL